MTLETGVNKDRNVFTRMAILAAVSIGFMQDIADKGWTVTAMRIVAGAAVAQFTRNIRVLPLN